MSRRKSLSLDKSLLLAVVLALALLVLCPQIVSTAKIWRFDKLKTEEEVKIVLQAIERLLDDTESYEEGILEALKWVLDIE